MSSRRYQPSSSSMNKRRQHGASQCSQSGNRATAVMSISPKNERLRSMLDARAAFREQVERFVHERYALDPTAATIAGIHDHDARLGDLSEAGFAARDAFADRWLHVLESHDGQAWPAADLDPERGPPVYVVVAGESATAGATFVRAVLPSLAPAGSKAKASLTGAGKRAGDALDQYASWLRDDLMRRAKGSFAIGRDAYDALLRDKELLPYDASSLKKWGEELYAETASKLAEAARALGDAEWRDSLERLRKDHPAEDELV